MLVSLGLDFRRAGLEIRERFHLGDSDVARVSDALAARGARETVLTRTCNRVEAYCWWPDAGASRPVDPALEIARAWTEGDASRTLALRAHARVRRAGGVPRHLFRVAAGLESQVLGDVHILGQLRRAFRDAVEMGSIGSHLHRLFETALRIGKQVQRDTGLAAARSSVGAEAARFAAARAGGLEGRRCVVVGCGKSGAHAARAFARLGAADLTVLNRTEERARRLARDLGRATGAGLDALATCVTRADVVVVATGAAEPLVSARAVRAMRRRVKAPLLIVDVSVPRNVETGVGALPGVELVDLDSLRPEAPGIERLRRQAIPEAEAIVEDGVDDFEHWLDVRAAGRRLRPFREVLSEICRREVAFLVGESPGARRTADRIVARVMAHPMSALRTASLRGAWFDDAADALAGLFSSSMRSPSEPAESDGIRSAGIPRQRALSSGS